MQRDAGMESERYNQFTLRGSNVMRITCLFCTSSQKVIVTKQNWHSIDIINIQSRLFVMRYPNI